MTATRKTPLSDQFAIANVLACQRRVAVQRPQNQVAGGRHGGRRYRLAAQASISARSHSRQRPEPMSTLGAGKFA